MENDERQNLREEFGRYLMGNEKPLKSFNVGNTGVVLTNERLLCLKRFPKSFIPVFYDDIRNIEHHTYIAWNKIIKGVVLLAAAVYAFYNPSLMNSTFDFLNQNIPELTPLLSISTPQQTLLFLATILAVLGLYQLTQFVFSLTGKLRISVKGAPSIRIRTGFSPEVGDLIKTLEGIRKGGIKEAFEEGVVEPATMDLKPGKTYIIREYRPDKSTKLFFNEVSSTDLHGLYISRMNPKDVVGQQDLINISYYWLTDSITDSNSVSPEPERVFALITDFLEKNPKGETVILLDGIEYLITHSNFDQVLHLIQGLVDKIGVNSSRFIIPLNPDALSSKEMALLERDVSIVL
ncbi:MAG: hypothetical protein B6U72_00645 [Candidatus Altiarchaeales archaeon ex4484_2]|nr:MAG: hypothetical protein B6U72_00645 [Candidatus Altiarchaeales archaeon ex4484_2]